MCEESESSLCGSFCVSSFFCLSHIHLLTFFTILSCRRRRPSNQSFFWSCRPFSFFPEHVLRTSNVEKRLQKRERKKKNEKKEERREKGQPKDASFSEPSFKSLVVVCGTLDRRHHGRPLVKKGTKKKGRKEGIKGEEAKDRPDRTISPSRRWVKLHHYTRRDVCFHVKPKRDERQRVFFVFEKREQRE